MAHLRQSSWAIVPQKVLNRIVRIVKLKCSFITAPLGQCGMHGRSAGTPTAGTPGYDIRVRVAYAQEEPGVVQVAGEGPHTGQAWKVARDERILLKANGGAGGAGGRGEDGQAGGCGRKGRDATKHRNGENGQDGAPGGK